MNKQETLEWVKQDLIYKRLKLEDIGFELDEVQDNTLLFDEDGLDLDSIDGLELAVGIEQKLGTKIGKLTKEVWHEKFQSPATITDFILELQSQLVTS